MKILAIGDVVGESGCNAVLKLLPKIKRQYNIDACIANGENSAKGNGILPSSAESLFSSGIDIITTGNHVFRRHEAVDYLDENQFCLRPGSLTVRRGKKAGEALQGLIFLSNFRKSTCSMVWYMI